MATLQDRKVSEAFSGLLPSSYVCLGVIGVGTVAFESLRRWKRPTRRSRTGKYAETAEDYSMAGYLYQSRTFEENVPERMVDKHPKWPLAWIWQVLKTPNYFYVEHSSVDAATYVRVIRGCFYYVLAQSLTVLPTLLAIHLHYSPDTYRATDINRASLSALVSDAANTHLLWVHTVCVYWMSITWALTLFWIGHGIIKMRRKQLEQWAALEADKNVSRGRSSDRQAESLPAPIENTSRSPNGDSGSNANTNASNIPKQNNNEDTINENHKKPVTTDSRPAFKRYQTINDTKHRRGWRHRTLVVTNIPNDLRSEAKLVEYFTDALHRLPDIASDTNPLLDGPEGSSHPSPRKKGIAQAALPGLPAPESPKRQRKGGNESGQPLVTRVVLIRRTFQLHETYRKREALLNELEKAHILLARNALKAVVEHFKRESSTTADDSSTRDLEKAEKSEKPNKQDLPSIDPLVVEALKPFLTPDDQQTSIWEVLRSLPPASLDRFQPLYRIRGRLFKGQKVPAIDYYLAKLNLTTAVLEDMRSSTDQIFASSPTAFVTFENAQDARRLLRDMPVHPSRQWACRIARAPDVRDIEFDKVVLTSFKGDVLRSFLVEGGIWLFIIFWVIPVSALLGLVSVQNIARIVPGLLNYFANHEGVQSLLTTLVPTVLLSILLFLVPTMLIQLSNRGQRFFTVSSLHHAVLARYWKFLFTDVVILFCVGRAAVESVFQSPGSLLQPSSLLNQIASAFPAAATFFVGYSILVCGIHNFFELMLMGFPFINHISVFNAKTPRQRYNLALPRSNNVYYTLPNHLLILSIVFVFQILNPLVTAFNLIYFMFALVVFKRSFRQYYWVRNYQLDGKLIYNRFMRFSLDALMTGQVVVVALLWVSKQYKYGGACIPTIVLTAFFKLTATRAFAAYSSMQDVEEAYIIAGQPHKNTKVEVLSVPLAPTWMRNLPPLTRIALRIKIHHSKEWEGFQHLESPRESSADRSATNSPATPMANSNTTSCDPTVQTSDPTDDKLQRQKPPTAIPAIVTDHPPLQRDDRTDFSAEYDNPFLTLPLKNSLWLPRHPGYCIDLNDTIDYHGLALVSSGTDHTGAIGQWEQFATVPDDTEVASEGPETAAETSVSQDGSLGEEEERLTDSTLRPTTPPRTAKSEGLRQRLSIPSIQKARRSLNGSEQILTSPGIADRAQSEAAVNDDLRDRARRSPSVTSPGSRRSPSQRIVSSPLAMRRPDRPASVLSGQISPVGSLPSGRPRAKTNVSAHNVQQISTPSAVSSSIQVQPPSRAGLSPANALSRRSHSNLSGHSNGISPTIMEAVSQDAALREIVMEEVQKDMANVPDKKAVEEEDVEEEVKHQNKIKSVTSSFLQRIWPSGASQW